MSGDSVNFNQDFYKITNIVNSWLADNDLPSSWHPKMLSRALKGLRRISIDRWQEPKSILITVDSKHTYTLPVDYVNWSKVGIKIGQYLKTLAVNPEMHQLVRQEGDDVIAGLPLYKMPNGIESSNYGGYQFFNYNGETLFGYGCGGGLLPSKGHFDIVKRGESTREITFDYDISIGTKIVLEYISDGLCADGESVVDPMLVDFLEAEMDHFYERKFNPSRSEASINRTSRDLWDAEQRVAARKGDLDMRTLQTISRRNTNFLPKI